MDCLLETVNQASTGQTRFTRVREGVNDDTLSCERVPVRNSFPQCAENPIIRHSPRQLQIARLDQLSTLIDLIK